MIGVMNGEDIDVLVEEVELVFECGLLFIE